MKQTKKKLMVSALIAALSLVTGTCPGCKKKDTTKLKIAIAKEVSRTLSDSMATFESETDFDAFVKDMVEEQK